MRSGQVQILRGDVVLVALDPVVGSEQGKTRPAIVVQNNVGNKYSPTTIIVPLTTKIDNVFPADALLSDSKALCSQIRTIDKLRIHKKIGAIGAYELGLVDDALKISLGL